MQIWVVSVVVLFVGIQAYQWLSQLTLPLPIYGVAGVLLAIASNSTRFRLPSPPTQPLEPLTPAPAQSTPSTSPPEPIPSEAESTAQNASISFKISRD